MQKSRKCWLISEGKMSRVILLLLLHLFSATSALNSDGLSLVSFKKSIFSDPEKAMADWDDSDATPCRWSGIMCANIRGESEPRVESLTLSKKQLVGSISPDLGSLPYLQHLNLRGNQLIGSIPAPVFNATGLQTILLSDNDLSGALPDALSRIAASLTLLDLSGNGFSGTIPPAIASCENLQTLVLAGNRFTGAIPNGISKLTGLRRLDLSSNSLTGSIPADLGDLAQLQGTLNLSANNLSGLIPTSLGRLPISLGIDLSFNNLSGPIPLNGTLSNQGPTAFLGNPNLCGLPLKNKCSPVTQSEEDRPPALPNTGASPDRKPPVNSSAMEPVSGRKSKSGLSSEQVVAIAVGDSVGVLLIVLALGYCFYCRRGSSGKGMMRSEKLCAACVSAVRDDNSDTDQNSAAVHDGYYHSGGELLHFDGDSEKLFDLDDLLRASAYVLGKGNSGIVYKAVMEGGLSVVVRRLELGVGADSSKKMIKEFESEVKAIGSIRHPNIVALRAYYWGMNEKLLVYDFLPNGSLAAALEQHQQHWLMIQEGSDQQGETVDHPACLSWPQRLSIAKDVARGLAFLHEGSATRRNLHGNVKPSNILLDTNCHACISDYGIGRLAEILACHDTISSTSSLRSDVAPGNRSSRSNVEPPVAVDQQDNPTAAVSGSSSSLSMHSAANSIYRPPEALPGLRPTQKWDVYSFGVIVLELLTGSASAQLASSEVDLVLAVRRMLVSAALVIEGDGKELGASQSVGSSNGGSTTTMLMAGIRAEAEAMELMQLGLRCVCASPEQRPKMKHVLEALNRIAPSD